MFLQLCFELDRKVLCCILVVPVGCPQGQLCFGFWVLLLYMLPLVSRSLTSYTALTCLQTCYTFFSEVLEDVLVLLSYLLFHRYGFSWFPLFFRHAPLLPLSRACSKGAV